MQERNIVHLFYKLNEEGIGAYESSPISTVGRSLAWKYYFGMLDFESLDMEEFRRNRNVYELLYKKEIDEVANVELDDDPLISNPLSLDSNNAYNEVFEIQNLERTIIQDLERLFPERDFFLDEEIRENLKKVLLVWARENDDISYRQGMHELLGMILYVLVEDCKYFQKQVEGSEEKESLEILREICDPAFVENDAYFVFSKLMAKMKQYFLIKKQSDDSLPIQSICEKIQNEILLQKDPAVSKRLQELSIHPQLYLIRFIRCLFGREFHFDDTLYVWDVLFSDAKGFRKPNPVASDIEFSLAEHIAVVMIFYVRETLLFQDYNKALKRLMRYPPVENIKVIVEHAIRSRSSDNPFRIRPTQQPQKIQSPKKYKTPELIHAQHLKRLAKKREDIKQKPRKVSKSPKPLGSSHISRNKETPRPLSTNTKLANVLEKLLFVFENEMKDTPSDEHVDMTMSLAEMKKLVHVLKGDLNFEDAYIADIGWLEDYHQTHNSLIYQKEQMASKTNNS